MSARIEKYPGHEVSLDDIRKLSVTDYKVDLEYAWSTGVALRRFLKELAKGKIIGRKCLKCKRVLVPPRMFCEQCFRPTDSWELLKDTGRVNTYSISYVAADASRLKKPIIDAVIEIDGASPGMGFLHLLGEVKHENVRVGMKVKAVWKPEKERTGAITDILYYKPLNGR